MPPIEGRYRLASDASASTRCQYVAPSQAVMPRPPSDRYRSPPQTRCPSRPQAGRSRHQQPWPASVLMASTAEPRRPLLSRPGQTGRHGVVHAPGSIVCGRDATAPHSSKLKNPDKKEKNHHCTGWNANRTRQVRRRAFYLKGPHFRFPVSISMAMMSATPVGPDSSQSE